MKVTIILNPKLIQDMDRESGRVTLVTRDSEPEVEALAMYLHHNCGGVNTDMARVIVIADTLKINQP